MIEIRPGLVIPESELRFSASRGGGPGGQHVNKVSTRVTVEFDVDGSAALSDAQRKRIHERLASRLTRDGRLRLSSARQRSQAANRREVVERLARLLGEALRPRPRRVASRVPPAERRRRREDKRRRGLLKSARRGGADDT